MYKYNLLASMKGVFKSLYITIGAFVVYYIILQLTPYEYAIWVNIIAGLGALLLLAIISSVLSGVGAAVLGQNHQIASEKYSIIGIGREDERYLEKAHGENLKQSLSSSTEQTFSLFWIVSITVILNSIALVALPFLLIYYVMQKFSDQSVEDKSAEIQAELDEYNAEEDAKDAAVQAAKKKWTIRRTASFADDFMTKNMFEASENYFETEEAAALFLLSKGIKGYEVVLSQK